MFIALLWTRLNRLMFMGFDEIDARYRVAEIWMVTETIEVGCPPGEGSGDVITPETTCMNRYLGDDFMLLRRIPSVWLRVA